MDLWQLPCCTSHENLTCLFNSKLKNNILRTIEYLVTEYSIKIQSSIKFNKTAKNILINKQRAWLGSHGFNLPSTSKGDTILTPLENWTIHYVLNVNTFDRLRHFIGTFPYSTWSLFFCNDLLSVPAVTFLVHSKLAFNVLMTATGVFEDVKSNRKSSKVIFATVLGMKYVIWDNFYLARLCCQKLSFGHVKQDY